MRTLLILAALVTTSVIAQVRPRTAVAIDQSKGWADVCVFKIVTLQSPGATPTPTSPAITKQSQIVVDAVNGDPAFGNRVCKDDANTWPDGFNHVSVHVVRSASGASSPAITKSFSKPGFLSPPENVSVK